MALAEAVSECVALEQLVLGGNDVGEAAGWELRRGGHSAGVNVSGL